MRKIIFIVFMTLFGMANAQAVYLSDTRPLIGYGWIMTNDQVAKLMQQPQQTPRQPSICTLDDEETLYLVFKIRKNDVVYIQGNCLIYLGESKEPLVKMPFYQDRRWSGFYIRSIPAELIKDRLSERPKFKFKFKNLHRIY